MKPQKMRFSNAEPHFCGNPFPRQSLGLLAGDVVGNCERSATFGATTSQNLTAIFGSHSLAEAMFVDSATVGGLKSSFHFMIILIFFGKECVVRIRSAKLTNHFRIAKF